MYDPFFSWHLDIPIVIGLLVAECIYVLLVRRLWHKAGHYNMSSAWAWSIRNSCNLYCPRITTGYHSRTALTIGPYVATRTVVNHRSYPPPPWPVSTACRPRDTGGVQAAPA